MGIDTIFLMSLVTVGGCLLTLTRVIGWRKVLRHATAIDVIFTILLSFILAGTLTGILIALLAGLVMAGFLSVAKWITERVEASRAALARPTQEADDWCPGGTPYKL